MQARLTLHGSGDGRLHLLRQSAALVVVLSMLGGCASRGPWRLEGTDRPLQLEPSRAVHDAVHVSLVERRTDARPVRKTRMSKMRTLMRKALTPLAMTFTLLLASPVQALQQVEAQRQDRPISRRRAPDGERRQALAFARTELFFGTAKPGGVVTDEDFRLFLDEVVTPLFPDGLTVVKGDGQFKGADGTTIKENSYVLILLYPVSGQKQSSKSIDFIRAEYMSQHQQESVLRVDDPWLVWVSF